jgi:hypothetical protein
MRRFKNLNNVLIGATAAVLGTAAFVPRNDSAPTPTVSAKAVEIVAKAEPATFVMGGAPAPKAEAVKSGVAGEVSTALSSLSSSVKRLSHPRALEDAFKAYYAYKASNPGDVKKPYLYFVDYGLSSTTPRGYVFNMETRTVVDGPFMVAHGRGSGPKSGVPTRFSNRHGAATTSLGLYLAQETYAFSGKASGQFYRSIGLRLKGLSGDFNDNARSRGVVAHGAPYVTNSGSGRSEGCPAVDQSRAKRLMPMLSNGAMVFLFAPNESWLANDPWLTKDVG